VGLTAETDARNEFLVFGAPKIEPPEIGEVVDSLVTGWLGTGPKVRRFETDFRQYKGWGYPVALNSCTAALHLALLACDLKPGDEVITTPMTFCATVNAIIHAGGTPVLADVDTTTQNIDAEAIEASVTPRTRVVLPVHMAGLSCDMDAIGSICRRHDLMLIEDCAHAVETEWKGRKAGTFGDFSCFSFYATKNVAMGEGGLLLARDEARADFIRMLSLHGMSRDAWKRFSSSGYAHYEVATAGFKYNMMDLQAALGIHQLARVELNWQRRSEIWERYQNGLKGLPIDLPASCPEDGRHAYHLFTIGVDEGRTGLSRDSFLSAMTSRKIGVGVHYQSIPEHRYYQDRFGWLPERWPRAHRIGQTTASLPLSPVMSNDDVEDVIAAVHHVLS